MSNLAKTESQEITQPQNKESALNEIWKHARMMADSDLVPQAYKNKPSNCAIAIELATRLGSSPLMIMQGLDIIQGKPSWSSRFLIASVNACGRFSPIRYKFDGKEYSKEWSCVAYATDKETGEVLEGPKVSIAMAESEGWLGKSGSKWKTMPQLMLMYRSAAFFARVYAPEVSMGLHTAEEQEDMQFVQSQRVGGMPSAIRDALLAQPEATVTIPTTATVENTGNEEEDEEN